MRTITLLLLQMFVAASAFAGDENRVQANGYTLHYNALNTDFLTPEVARQYGLTRSKHRGMLNIAVLRDQAGTTGQPVTAKLRVEAADLMQKPKNIELREIREGDAIYYIGEFPIIHREVVNFRVQATPQGESRAINARFSQEFYVD